MRMCDGSSNVCSSAFRLERFRERFTTWRLWLSKDEHSVWNQVYRMLWEDMVFRTINECRRLADKSPSQSVGFNRDVASFVDSGYVAKQLLAIRRLTEITKRGDAITLPRILDDMKSNEIGRASWRERVCQYV